MITNKLDLIDAMVAERHGFFTKKTISVLVNDLLGSIARSLEAGNEVRIKGFGTFTVSDRAATTGRNPRTGEPIEIAAKRGVKFRASSALSGALNPE